MNGRPGKGRGLKIVLCICFLLLVVALLLIDQNSPATGYELSIYDSLPPLVWICLIASLAGGTGIIVHQAFAGRTSKYWLLGFFALILAVSIILLLPSFRGYYLYSASDTVGHLKWARQIVSEGHFWEHSKYPITHILMAQLAQVSNQSVDQVIKYVPVLFTILFMLFSYLLGRSVMPERGQGLLSAASTALFFNYYHVCIYPQALSIMLLPLVFYLYFKGFGSSSLSFRVAFVIVLLLFPYFHPAPAGVLIVCLLAAEGAKAMWRVRRGTSSSVASEKIDRITFEPALICSVAFLTWISSFYIFARTIRNVLSWLGGEIQTIPRVLEVEQAFERQGLGFQQQLELGLKMYGDNLIYLSLSAIALLIVGWRFLRHQDEVKNLSILSMPFLVSGPAWVLVFASTLLVTMGRLLGANIMMWATPVLAAFALYEIFRRWRRAGVIVATCILLCASVIGIFGVYHSPYILQVSWQVTRLDVQGSQWFQAHADLPSPGYYGNLGVPIGYGVTGSSVSIPEHFGYPRQQTLAGSLSRDTYVLLAPRFKLGSAHPTLPEATLSPSRLFRCGFSPADFQRLNRDPTVNRLYSNGEFDVLLVRVET